METPTPTNSNSSNTRLNLILYTPTPTDSSSSYTRLHPTFFTESHHNLTFTNHHHRHLTRPLWFSSLQRWNNIYRHVHLVVGVHLINIEVTESPEPPLRLCRGPTRQQLLVGADLAREESPLREQSLWSLWVNRWNRPGRGGRGGGKWNEDRRRGGGTGDNDDDIGDD